MFVLLVLSLIVFHCKGDPVFIIYSAFFQCHYCECSVQSIQLPDSSEVPWPIWVWRKQEQGELWNPAWAHLGVVCKGPAPWKLTHLIVQWVRSSAGTTWHHSMERYEEQLQHPAAEDVASQAKIHPGPGLGFPGVLCDWREESTLLIIYLETS